MAELNLENAFIDALLEEKWTDAHIHFERICNDESMDHYNPAFFTYGYFNYVNVYSRIQEIVEQDGYVDWFDNVSFFCI